MAQPLCDTLARCVFNYQTLIGGLLAIAAALAGAWAVLRAAKFPLMAAEQNKRVEEERRRRFFGAVLFQDLSALMSRCRMVEGIVTVLHAGNHRVTDESRPQMRLGLHPLVESWEFMSLLPDQFLSELIALQKAVAEHNYDVSRAGTFTEDNWRGSIVARLKAIGADANRMRGLATLLSKGQLEPGLVPAQG